MWQHFAPSRNVHNKFASLQTTWNISILLNYFDMVSLHTELGRVQGGWQDLLGPTHSPAGFRGGVATPLRFQNSSSIDSRMYFRNLKLNLLRGISDAQRQPNVLLKQCISLLQSSCLLQYTFFAPNFYIKNLKLISEKTNGNIFNFF